MTLRVLGYDAATLTLGYAAWIKDSQDAQQMKSVIDKAATKNYPVKADTVTPEEN